MTAVLTDTHRRAQLAVRARVVRDMQRLWPAMDWTRLDTTFPAWVTAVAALVDRYRATSTNLAAAYLRAFRTASGITGVAPIVPAERVPVAQVAAAMHVSAVAYTKTAATRGVTGKAAMDTAFVRSAGAVTRLVLGGGRDTIAASTAADRRAVGWIRVTSASPCDFCAGLADGTNSSGFAAHDHCGCTAEPVYR